MVKKNKVSINFIYSILYQLFIIILPLITTPYITRVLGAEKIGIYSYSNSVAALFVIFALLGISNYGTRSIARVKNEPQTLSRTFSSIYGFQLFTSGIIILIYFIYVALWAYDKYAALLAGLYVFSSAVDLNWALYGLEEFKYSTIRSLMVKIISVVFIFSIIKKPEDVYIYIAIISGGYLVSNLCAIPYLLKSKMKIVRCKVSEITVHCKSIIVLFTPLIGISIYKYLNKILLASYSTFEQVGLLESSERVLLVPISFVLALGNVMLPRMSELYIRNDSDDVEKYLENSFYFAVAASASMGFGIIAVIKEFVPIFYGSGFEKCEEIIPILMASPIFLAIANVVRTQYLIPKGKDKEYVVSILIGAGVNLCTAILFIPRFAAVGVAIATVCTEFTVCAIQVFLSRKVHNMMRYIIRSMLFVFPAIAMCIVVYKISFGFGLLVNLTVKIIIGFLLIVILDSLVLYLLKRVYPVHYVEVAK